MAAVFGTDVVVGNPLKEGLRAFSRLFDSTRTQLGAAASSNAVQVISSTVPATARFPFLKLNTSC